MRMTWKKACWLVAVVASGCFQGPEMLDVGRLDAGSGGGTGGMTSGGSGGGGGNATGGGGGGGASTGGGGGTQGTDAGFQIADAGFVARLPALPEARCKMPIPGACTNDGGCIEFLEADGGRRTLLTFGDALPELHGAGPNVIIERGTATGVSIELGKPDGTTSSLRTSTTPSGIFVMPETVSADTGYGTWFVLEHRETGMPAGRALLLAPGSSGPATFTNPIDARPTSNGVALGSTYFVAQPDGLYSFYPAGGGRVAQLTSVTGLEETIFAIATDDVREAFWVQCTNPYPGGTCSLWRYESPLNSTPRSTMLVQELPTLGGGVGAALSIRVLGNHVYLLGVEYLLRIPRTGGALELVYRGEEFPQYGGTLKSGSLETVDGKLYFGSICHFDADYPYYGTVELDLATSSARWLDLDPRWPIVPHLVDPEPFPNGWSPWATSAGTFVLRR
jgi:hypothetical protein